MSVAVKRIKDGINRLLAPAGYRISNCATLADQPTFDSMLARLVARRVTFNTVIDVGASDGNWSRRFSARLPAVKDFILIEAQSGVHDEGLRRFATDFPSARIVRAAAGDQRGDVHFDASDPWGGQAASGPTRSAGKWIRVPMTTIDNEIAASGFPGPYLIKLDTHGFEVPILAGALETLKQTAVLVIECYNFQLSPTALRFPEFCAHMDRLGFRCIDLFDPAYRPHDGALWQMDLVFIQKDAASFSSDQYAVGNFGNQINH